MQRAIHNHQGDVYDPFVGSGTTVIAGEQEGRRVFALEIAQAQTALDQLQAETWGVWLHEDAYATRYVVLPRGTLEVEGWPWTVQGQPAVLLSSE